MLNIKNVMIVYIYDIIASCIFENVGKCHLKMITYAVLFKASAMCYIPVLKTAEFKL